MLQNRNPIQLQYLNLCHCNIVFNNCRVVGSIRQIRRVVEQPTYYISIPSLTCVVITLVEIQCVGTQVGRQMGAWVGRQVGEGGGQGAQAGSLNVSSYMRLGQVCRVRKNMFLKKESTWAEEREKNFSLSSPPWLAQGQ